MKIVSFFSIFIAIISFSCSSNTAQEHNALKDSLAVRSAASKLEGSWIVESEKRYYEKDNKVTESFEIEQIDSESAYVYNFKSDSLVTVTNLNNEFSWDFKLSKIDSVLTLMNKNGDAEDDELIYRYANDKLFLLRKIEDADPIDENESHFVCFLLSLKKLK